MTGEDTEDIRRVISLCYRGINQMSDLDLERILSFDMEWLSPEEAEQSVSNLIDKGWLLGERNNLSPAFDIQNIPTTIGWFPRPARLISPTDFNPQQSNSIPQPSETSELVVTSHRSNTTVEISSKDPRAKLSTRLAKYVSRTAKISIEEIERRAERKQQALKYASNWLCLALIAREQNLPMEEIVAALSS